HEVLAVRGAAHVLGVVPDLETVHARTLEELRRRSVRIELGAYTYEHHRRRRRHGRQCRGEAGPGAHGCLATGRVPLDVVVGPVRVGTRVLAPDVERLTFRG